MPTAAKMLSVDGRMTGERAGNTRRIPLGEQHSRHITLAMFARGIRPWVQGSGCCPVRVW